MAQNNEEKIMLTGRLAEFRTAIEEEIKAINRSGQTSILLINGRALRHPGPDFWYEFSIEYLPSVPPDTPCKLKIGLDTYNVIIIRYSETSIVVASEINLPDTLAKAQLDTSATVILERLIDRLEKNASKPNLAGERLFTVATDQNDEVCQKISDFDQTMLAEELVPSQKTAIVKALQNNITFIWGPPGTGKTKVIGQIVLHMIQANRSVLLTSHTNTAVDGAIEKADENYRKSSKYDKFHKPYPILRVGKPSKDLPDHVGIDSHIEELGREIKEAINSLEANYARELTNLGKIKNLIAVLEWIKDTNIIEIRSFNNQHTNIESMIDTYQRHIDELTQVVSKHEDHFEQYESHKKLLIKKEKLQSDLKKMTSEMDASKLRLDTIPKEIQDAKDEVIKHKTLTDLNKRIDEQLSPSAQRQQLDSVKATLIALKNDRQNKIEALRSNRNKLSVMENKGAIAKLFQNKKEVEHTRELVSLSNEELSAINNRIQVALELHQQYEKNLQGLMLLIEQRRSIQISKTEAHWISTEVKLEAEKEKLLFNLKALEKKVTLTTESLRSVKQDMSKSQNAFDLINEPQIELNSAREALNILEQESVALQSQYLKATSTELRLIPEPYLSNLPNIESLKFLDCLSNELTTARMTASKLNLVSLLEEESEIKKRMDQQQKLLSELKNKYNALEISAIERALIIGTTLTRAYLNDAIQGRSFDTVIVDEASMAPIPALWCNASLASRNIVIVGDFLQLSPIVMAKKEKAIEWLGKDIFEKSGVKASARKGFLRPKCFVMLDQQFRMESEIAEIANIYYQDYSPLKSNDHTEIRDKLREKFLTWFSPPFQNMPGSQIVQLIDTSELHAWVTGVPQGKNASRVNYFSAAISIELAFHLVKEKMNAMAHNNFTPLDEPLVLIISPYRAHTKRLQDLINMGYRARGIPNNENPGIIEAGTIHQFQGSEAAIVIFDLVVDQPHWRANLFMPDDIMGDSLRQLFNVAVTRAQFRLYILGNIPYCIKKAKSNTLGVFIEKLVSGLSAPIINAKRSFNEVIYTLPSSCFTTNQKIPRLMVKGSEFDSFFKQDIQKCHSSLIIFSPFLTIQRISELLPYITDAINRGCNVTVVTKTMSERRTAELGTYLSCETILKQQGVKIIHKKGMHEKFVFVDQNIFWNGSLNALSFGGSTGEFMERCDDEEYTMKVRQMLELYKYEATIAQSDANLCPSCDTPMVIADGYKAGVYWKCDNKNCISKTKKKGT